MNINHRRMHGVYDPMNDECPPPYAPAGGMSLVETAGYVPKEKQLEMLLQSGANLDRYLRDMFPAQSPPEEFDPTIQKGYDFFDWHADTTFVQNQLEEAARHDATQNKVVADVRTKDGMRSSSPQSEKEPVDKEAEANPANETAGA